MSKCWKTRTAMIIGTAVAALALSGCGWTSRDQFLVDQSVTVKPTPGDGSIHASHVEPDPFMQPETLLEAGTSSRPHN